MYSHESHRVHMPTGDPAEFDLYALPSTIMSNTATYGVIKERLDKIIFSILPCQFTEFDILNLYKLGLALDSQVRYIDWNFKDLLLNIS